MISNFDMSPRRIWTGLTIPGKKMMVAMNVVSDRAERGQAIIALYKTEPHSAFLAAALALHNLNERTSVTWFPPSALLADVRDFLKLRFRANGRMGSASREAFNTALDEILQESSNSQERLGEEPDVDRSMGIEQEEMTQNQITELEKLRDWEAGADPAKAAATQERIDTLREQRLKTRIALMGDALSQGVDYLIWHIDGLAQQLKELSKVHGEAVRFVSGLQDFDSIRKDRDILRQLARQTWPYTAQEYAEGDSSMFGGENGSG